MVRIVGGSQLQVDGGHGLRDRHVLVVFGLAAAGIVVEEGRRLGIGAVAVVSQVSQRGQPLAMGGLVLAHEQKRLRLVAVAKPFEAKLGDDVGRVTLLP